MALLRRHRPQQSVSTSRIEAFSDGVFAIAITLLVLEIHVPNPTQGPVPRALADSLRMLWPSYFGYIVSFVVVGIYWANHHHLFHLFRGTDHGLNLLNLLLLFWICFIPFPTAVISEYLEVPGQERMAILFYMAGLFAPAASWFLLWLYASWHHRLLDPDLDPDYVRKLTRQFGWSMVVYLIALALAWWKPELGLVGSVIITGLYLLPPKPAVYKTGAHSSIE